MTYTLSQISLVKEEDLILKGLPVASGMEEYELLVMSSLVNFLKPKRVLEIGTKHARTTINIAKFSPEDALIWSLDINQLPHQNLIPYDYHGKIIFLEGDSTQYNYVGRGMTDFDFIFIDGNHLAQYVKDDTYTAFKLIKPGGTIVWHDFGKVGYETIQVKEALAEMQIFPIHIPNTSLALMQSPLPSRKQ